MILAGRHAAACLMRRPQQVLGPIAAAKSSGAALSRGNAGVDIELDPVEGSFEAGELVGPAVSHVRTTGSGATLGIGCVARREHWSGPTGSYCRRTSRLYTAASRQRQISGQWV